MFSKGLDSFLVELVLGFEQIACKRHPTRWKSIRNLIFCPLFISCVFNIATDKCFFNDFFCLTEVVVRFTMLFLSNDGRLNSADIQKTGNTVSHLDFEI